MKAKTNMKNSLKGYFVFLGIFTLLVIILAILQLIPSTSLEPAYRYKYRYESFLRLLNDEEKKLFLQGNYKECAKLLELRMTKDEKLKNRILEIKEFEAIETFPTELTLEYFGYYLYNEVVKYIPDYKPE
ncbi:MAG: hypothetical protein ABDH28_07405 [Brevinematia bacterium]